MLAVPAGKAVRVALATTLHSKHFTRRGMAAQAALAARAAAAVAFTVLVCFSQSPAPSLPTPPAKVAMAAREAGADRALALK
jgi:hypothetical protein